MTDQHDRGAVFFRESNECLSAIAHLRYRTGHAPSVGVVHSLNGIDHENIGSHRGRVREDVGNRCFGHNHEAIAHRTNTLSAHTHLFG